MQLLVYMFILIKTIVFQYDPCWRIVADGLNSRDVVGITLFQVLAFFGHHPQFRLWRYNNSVIQPAPILYGKR